jgi:hypothetical protein
MEGAMKPQQTNRGRAGGCGCEMWMGWDVVVEERDVEPHATTHDGDSFGRRGQSSFFRFAFLPERKQLLLFVVLRPGLPCNLPTKSSSPTGRCSVLLPQPFLSRFSVTPSAQSRLITRQSQPCSTGPHPRLTHPIAPESIEQELIVQGQDTLNPPGPAVSCPACGQREKGFGLPSGYALHG